MPISLDYAPVIFGEFTDEITRYMYPITPKEITETEAFIKESMQKFEDGKDIVVAVLKKDSKEYVGNSGLHNIDTPTPELGIWIKKGAHGNGYGKEAVAGLKMWADSNLTYEYLKYPVVEENMPSRKIAESLGGEVFLISSQTFKNGKVFSLVDYRIYPPK